MTISKSRSKLLNWLLFVGDTVFLYFVSVLPLEELPEAMRDANDLALHFFNFVILTLLGAKALQRVAPSAVFSFFYGGFLEWMQLSVPGRSATLVDWAADAVGCLAAWAVFRISRLTHPA